MTDSTIELSPSYAKEVAELVTESEEIRRLQERLFDTPTHFRIEIAVGGGLAVVMDNRGDFAGSPARFTLPHGGHSVLMALVKEAAARDQAITDRLAELGVIAREEP